MNLRFLGDALDHWKGSIFEGLQQSSVLNDFKVDAMASDAEDWQSHDLELFAKLLRIRGDQIVPHEKVLNGNRSQYFDEIPGDCDIFLDPDTGFKTSYVKDMRQYIEPDEFFSLLQKNDDRIIAVYQHASRGSTIRTRLKTVLKILHEKQPDLSCISYESANVALLFFSLKPSRIEAMGKHFKEVLGLHCDKRVYKLSNPATSNTQSGFIRTASQ